MYRLHSFCQSGSAFKVAFLLRALNQPWEPVFVDFMNGETREASLPYDILPGERLLPKW